MKGGFVYNTLLKMAKAKGHYQAFIDSVEQVKREYPHANLHKNPFILIGLYKKITRSNGGI